MASKLEAAHREISLARTALQRMESAAGNAQFEEAYKDFIGRLTRFWNKTEASLKCDPKFYNSPHVKRVKDALKNDELIRYLARARDADEHTAQEITVSLPGGDRATLTTPDGNQLMIQGLTINGKPAKFQPAPNVVIQKVNDEVAPRDFTNRGQQYTPPMKHRGIDLPLQTRLVELAAMGLRFYEEALEGLQKDGWS